jgi:hypothetical protein
MTNSITYRVTKKKAVKALQENVWLLGTIYFIVT